VETVPYRLDQGEVLCLWLAAHVNGLVTR
jgi:hypothetical protein